RRPTRRRARSRAVRAMRRSAVPALRSKPRGQPRRRPCRSPCRSPGSARACALLIRSLAPALAAGCTTVMKMPGQTAQVNALISRVFTEVKSLPRGVINMITGEREVLSYLVESPDVPTISFTGSTTTGRAISQAGAARIKRFGLELGGKTPMIVFDDADIDAALPKLEKALTIFAG